MRITFKTIRLWLVPLMAVSLSVGGPYSMVGLCIASGSHNPQARDCCGAGVSAPCCAGVCRQAPAPMPQRPNSEVFGSHQDRLHGGPFVWLDLGPSTAAHAIQRERAGYSPAVPAFGSPSLITQHIRLQI